MRRGNDSSFGLYTLLEIAAPRLGMDLDAALGPLLAACTRRSGSQGRGSLHQLEAVLPFLSLRRLRALLEDVDVV